VQIDEADEAEQQHANGGLADDEDEAEGGDEAYMERLARIRERIKVRRRPDVPAEHACHAQRG
jgi:hypothetical protein